MTADTSLRRLAHLTSILEHGRHDTGPPRRDYQDVVVQGGCTLDANKIVDRGELTFWALTLKEDAKQDFAEMISREFRYILSAFGKPT